MKLLKLQSFPKVFNTIDKSWTLFLDRDGVINERIPGKYIADLKDLKLTPGCRQAIASFNFVFNKIVVVTNQAGIGKGITSETAVRHIHDLIQKELAIFHGKIHQFYFCPDPPNTGSACRKPATGMALQAQIDFPEIDFRKSIIVGDSHSDMEFGKALGMSCILIDGKLEEAELLKNYAVDGRFNSLFEFAQALQEHQEI